MKLKEIYTKKFLEKFGEKSNKVGELELEESKPYINLERIAEAIDIEMDSKMVENDGQYDHENKIISINSNRPLTRQRFTVAHELGHALLGHPGISLRSTSLAAYSDVVDASREVEANKFAADLLMPRSLMVRLTLKIIKDRKWNQDKLTPIQIDELIEHLACQLGVSVESMNYRVKNVDLFGKRDD